MMGSPKAFDEKIDLNYDVAVIGGAKLFVDQTRTTRSISKKLVSYCGLNENEFLYGGLDRGHSEMKAAFFFKIVESYALEVASQVAGRSRKRRIVGIPFNIHLLDDEEG
uniref:Uncharacterized protein n=1 Tax=Parascaris equorum TaxID=6256 RepID=A0A914RSM0_PAREQ